MSKTIRKDLDYGKWDFTYHKMNYLLIYNIWILDVLLEIKKWFRSSIMITMMIKINTNVNDENMNINKN